MSLYGNIKQKSVHSRRGPTSTFGLRVLRYGTQAWMGLLSSFEDMNKEKIENWEKALDEQWKVTDHYVIWGWWVKDMIKKLLKAQRQEIIEEIEKTIDEERIKIKDVLMRELELREEDLMKCPECGKKMKNVKD